MESIFIAEYNYDKSWIIGKMAEDMVNHLTKMGYKCRVGQLSDYQGEDIVYHLNYHRAKPIPEAKHNSVYYTHSVNLEYEMDLERDKGKFDSYICMSPEDAQFLIELGFNPDKVYGRTLPIRNAYVKPLTIGIFSACYSYYTVKNEDWIVEYCQQNPKAKYIDWVFVGAGWNKITPDLEKLGCSFEWHNISRDLPYEYRFQQEKLASLNFYIYMGMDGGAMGTYDAYAMNVPLCVTFDGFHKSIPDLDYTFDDKQSFFNQIDKILDKHLRRIEFFNTHTPENYAKWILSVWQGAKPEPLTEKDKGTLSFTSVADKKHSQYYVLSFKEILRVVSKMLLRMKERTFTPKEQ